MTDESWTVRARKGDYRAIDAASQNRQMDYAVDGLMPATGATIWFGAGSTGKTQLLLWMAAHMAAVGDAAPRQWLGADLGVRGNILVLTAEDLREHLLLRIGSIAHRLMQENGGTEEDAVALCQRIHVMAFLSMTQTEFPEPNACLFQHGPGGRWRPSPVLDGIEAFLDDWNKQVEEDGRPEDRIVGVILDSAVSMAGFELANSEAATNFLFHLNRLSYRQKMFWAVIGHTPKDAARKTEDAAIERLRGSAMWSTTPRSVVEVRLAGASENLETVRAVHPGLTDRDVVIVEVAKANSLGADLRPRVLLRRKKDGAYDDITADFPGIFGAASLQPRGKKGLHTDELRKAVLSLLASFDSGKPNTVIERDALRAAFNTTKASCAVLATITDEVDGEKAKTPGTLARELALISKDGLIDTRRGKIRIVNLGFDPPEPIAEAAE
ncbi:AAA family ATPase [uncultured Sphingomonas sp.]|uniref:AAA family ATPase n=1 Tax=uncultured Sphingomonas sp. TaxID=158754 RepID=UPI0025869A4D|nr:AAA family ATPase [uncultured Sphingomonas sp.]